MALCRSISAAPRQCVGARRAGLAARRAAGASKTPAPALAAAALAVALAHSPPAWADAPPWPPCKPGSSCVSTSSFMSPAQYLPPWNYAPDSRVAALRALLAQLREEGASILEAEPSNGYVSARLPTGRGGYDELQLRLQDGGVVLFRSQASADRPYPPFCISRGCISGPANRGRLEALRDALGWAVLETDEDKAWQQLLLH